MRLTLRTLLAYLDDTLPPDQARLIGQKVTESEYAQELMDRLKKITRRRGLSTPGTDGSGTPSDPNKVAEYLSDALPAEEISYFEKICLDSDVHLAEVTACHQILTLLLSEPVRVPPTARQRMYQLVKGPESLPKKKPGNTIPVGGILPEDMQSSGDDSDATYLLGMKPYSAAQTSRTRLTSVLLPLILLVAMSGVLWIAWPRGVADSTDTVAMPVIPVPADPADAKRDAKTPGKADAKAIAPEQPKKPVEPGKDDKKDTPAVKIPVVVIDPKVPVIDSPPEIPEPRQDRLSIGKLDTTESVLLSQAEGGKWLRVGKPEPTVFTTERLVSLPGYKSKISLDTGVQLELWGNLPEQLYSTLLESSLTIHAPTEGFDADLTAFTGRFYLQSKKPAGIKVRLRVLKEVWDITLPDDKSEVVFELTHALERGMTNDIDDKVRPLTALQMVVLKGTATLKIQSKDYPRIAAGESVTWTSKSQGILGPRKTQIGMRRDSAYFSRFPLYADETVAKGVQQSLNDLSNSLIQPDLIRVKLGEMLDETAPITAQTFFRCRQAVLSSAAISDLATLADALIDSKRPFVRDAAIYGLLEVVPNTPDGLETFRKLLVDKIGLSEEQSKLAIRLMRGPTEAERADGAVEENLVNLLDPKTALVLRELAFWVLRNDIDPESRSISGLIRVDMNGPAEVIEAARTAWKRRLDDLRKKALDSK